MEMLQEFFGDHIISQDVWPSRSTDLLLHDLFLRIFFFLKIMYTKYITGTETN